MASCLSRASNPSIPYDDINRPAELLGVAIARVQLVATDETIRAASAVQRAFLQACFDIMRARHPLVLRQSDIDLANKWMQIHNDERSRLIELMKTYNRDGLNDENRWNQLQRQEVFATEQYAEQSATWDRLSLLQLKEQRALIKTIIEKLLALMDLQISALVSIRRELEMSDSETVLAEELDLTSKAMQQSLEEMIKTVEAEELKMIADTEEQRRTA